MSSAAAAGADPGGPKKVFISYRRNDNRMTVAVLQKALRDRPDIAKVFRDAIMRRLEEAHPGYGFGKHMGYATAFHLRAIESRGPSPVHRLSFSPIAGDPQLPLEGLSR